MFATDTSYHDWLDTNPSGFISALSILGFILSTDVETGKKGGQTPDRLFLSNKTG